MDLERIFKSVGEKLRIDFDFISSEIEHRQSKGRVREIELVEQFLRKYLPLTIGISHGEIVATNGDTSNECDIVFFETRTCPILLDKTGYQVFPVECVYGLMEVKSLLNENELKDALKKISKVKTFPKVAYAEESGDIERVTKMYGKEFHYFPVTGFVFAYDSIDLLKLQDYLIELQKDLSIDQWIDSVWVLKKGMLVYTQPPEDILHSTPRDNTRLRALKSENPLLLMTIQLQHILQQGWMPNFRIEKYLDNAKIGRFIGE